MSQKSRLSLIAILALIAMALTPQITMASSLHSNGQRISLQSMVIQQSLHNNPHHSHHPHHWYPFQNTSDTNYPGVLPTPTAPNIPIIPSANTCLNGISLTYSTLIVGATTVNVVVDNPTFATATISISSAISPLLATPSLLIGADGVITIPATAPVALILGTPTITLGVGGLGITILGVTYPLVTAGCA
jgi:hypothetical protein